MSEPILDGNAAQIRAIIQQTVSALDATRDKRQASVPAWAGVIISVVTFIFMAGSLSGDVAVAKTQASDATKSVSVIQADIASIKATLTEMQKQQERDRR